jgi:hypothetical protein
MDVLYFVVIMSALFGMFAVKDSRDSRRKLRDQQRAMDYFFRTNK